MRTNQVEPDATITPGTSVPGLPGIDKVNMEKL